MLPWSEHAFYGPYVTSFCLLARKMCKPGHITSPRSLYTMTTPTIPCPHLSLYKFECLPLRAINLERGQVKQDWLHGHMHRKAGWIWCGQSLVEETLHSTVQDVSCLDCTLSIEQYMASLTLPWACFTITQFPELLLMSKSPPPSFMAVLTDQTLHFWIGVACPLLQRMVRGGGSKV